MTPIYRFTKFSFILSKFFFIFPLQFFENSVTAWLNKRFFLFSHKNRSKTIFYDFLLFSFFSSILLSKNFIYKNSTNPRSLPVNYNQLQSTKKHTHTHKVHDNCFRKIIVTSIFKEAIRKISQKSPI